jgi:hypothetical protein
VTCNIQSFIHAVGSNLDEFVVCWRERRHLLISGFVEFLRGR